MPSVHIEFRLEGIDPIAGIRAVVRNVRGSGGTQIFGLEIVDWEALHTRLPPALFATFNRRRHHRVDVARATPVEVVLARAAGGETVRAALRNVSIGGCQLDCPAGGVPSLGDEVGLSFTLPDSAELLALSGLVRSVMDTGDGARCGIEFQSIGSREQRSLTHYVMARQRELAKVARAR